jgi:hypothetical protein
MRSKLFVIGATLLSVTPAAAACQTVPFAETPKVLLSEFGYRMARTGTSEWMLATQTARGPMYINLKSDLRISIMEKGGLVDEVTVLISEPTPAETIRFESAALFLTSHFSGHSETEISDDVINKARKMQSQKVSTVAKYHNTVAFFQYIEGGYVVVVGNRRCD